MYSLVLKDLGLLSSVHYFSGYPILKWNIIKHSGFPTDEKKPKPPPKTPLTNKKSPNQQSQNFKQLFFFLISIKLCNFILIWISHGTCINMKNQILN